MLKPDGFNEFSLLQASIFTPQNNANSTAILKALLKDEYDIFDGEPMVLPLPVDAPADIPRVTLTNKNNSYKLEVSPSRMNFFRNKVSENDKIAAEDFLRKSIEFFEVYMESLSLSCGRIAALIQRFQLADDPGKQIADHFCKDHFLKEPFDRPSDFEIHSLKKYKFLGRFDVNSWVRVKSGIIRGNYTDKTNFEKVIFLIQDINTFSEIIDEKTYNNEDIKMFFDGISSEFDSILNLYFRDAK